MRQLKEQYIAALQDCFLGAGEAALARAYELGRKAVAEGLGPLEWAAIHHEAMMTVLRRRRMRGETTQKIKVATDFFLESLSPFEMTHRGYWEATAMVRQVVQFAAVLSHELRMPLTSVLASADMLREMLSPDPQSTPGNLLANILAGAEALRARMDDLVDIAGFQSGQLSMHVVPVDVGALLRELCQRLEPVVTRVGLRFQSEIPENLPVIQADPRRLEQVVTNLVQNAIKYGSDGGRIDIRARLIEKSVMVEVQDYGNGISPSDQSKLFQLYFRAEQDRKSITGLGIGLALCRQLIETQGGKIWVESEIGKGSSFKFSLPLAGPTRDG